MVWLAALFGAGTGKGAGRDEPTDALLQLQTRPEYSGTGYVARLLPAENMKNEH